MSKMSRELLDAMHRFALEQAERGPARYEEHTAGNVRRAAAGARA
jgi:hypothetical protein